MAVCDAGVWTVVGAPVTGGEQAGGLGTGVDVDVGVGADVGCVDQAAGSGFPSVRVH